MGGAHMSQQPIPARRPAAAQPERGAAAVVIRTTSARVAAGVTTRAFDLHRINSHHGGNYRRPAPAPSPMSLMETHYER